ncbi:probable pectinesterase 29 [Phragmites australis]|uniref:probable pectinesterase 29 n=1 Tax=Phragmites australis TaxID=29695 RepID=UPI002D784B3E|nr:probable pectinesterase 29 [Phragmites australis]
MQLGLGPWALAIGVAVLASMAMPRGCDAAGTVVRNIFVSRNGSAGFKSIQDAVDSVPYGNGQWIRVHVAAGVYNEKVIVPRNKSFILLEGEGRQQTSIEWADHAGGDSGTASSPTFAAYATDFMARDITFKVRLLALPCPPRTAQHDLLKRLFMQPSCCRAQNTYNGDGRVIAPAVAALVAGDRSSFYRCGFVSVQDTLSDLEGRHYYEGCYIEGAMDFIFGNGQSIFQGCEISTARTPVWPGFITAHGRCSEADTSGFVFKGCAVGGVTPAYLGRAWRGYARVIFYQTAMSGVVVRQGWDAWNYKGREGTLTMVEAGCTGQGSNQMGRVPWTKALPDDELAKFVDLSYVSADGWLDAQPH